ncbi:ABC transporter permease [Streptomyces sp. CBG31]|uniref:ABC transporter permease n=1 Tax=Streptomyces sp. CBG31 TaxID=2762623 RepID=UPI0016463C70|nr:ABC transporter permease subunit [Streptomyces sp. CBG31]
MPEVTAVRDALVSAGGDPLFYESLGVTVLRVSLGFLLAFAVAVVVGISMGRVEFVRRFFEPAVLIGLTVPGLVWALLCVMWFGISLANPVVAVALSAAPALTLNIYQGTRAMDGDLRERPTSTAFRPGTSFGSCGFPPCAPRSSREPGSACRCPGK